MRYREIIEEQSKLDRVMAASRKKSDAARKYQDKMRLIAQTAPPKQKPDREAAARRLYQDQLRSADDALYRALASD